MVDSSLSWVNYVFSAWCCSAFAIDRNYDYLRSIVISATITMIITDEPTILIISCRFFFCSRSVSLDLIPLKTISLSEISS